MRFVSVKTVEQQDIQAVHRIRADLIEQRMGRLVIARSTRERTR
jgi:hypothetical protein